MRKKIIEATLVVCLSFISTFLNAQNRKLEVDLNGKTAFQTIQSAIDYIETQNLTENIDIVLNDGTYNETIQLKNIVDFSDTYQIHIYSKSKSAKAVKITSNNKTVRLLGSNYKLSYLSIENTAKTLNNAAVVSIINTTDIQNFEIDNCEIIGVTTNDEVWEAAAIHLDSRNKFNSFIIRNSKIKNSSYGLHLWYFRDNNPKKLIIENNIFSNTGRGGISINSIDQFTIHNNSFLSNSKSSEKFTAIDCRYTNSNGQISSNKIVLEKTKHWYLFGWSNVN